MAFGYLFPHYKWERAFIRINMVQYLNGFLFHFRPDLIQYDKLQKSNGMHNLNNAFKIAEEKLGITPLLDAEGNIP